MQSAAYLIEAEDVATLSDVDDVNDLLEFGFAMTTKISVLVSHMNKLPSKQEILDWISDNPTLTAKRDIAKAFGIKGPDRIEPKKILRELKRMAT